MKIILKRISLFGALALAAILLMSCRALPDVAELECWIVFRHGSSCTVMNAEGESLTYRDDGAVFGTMERYESSYGGLGYDNCIDIDMFRVPSSASFTVEGIQGQSSVEVIWGKAYSGSAEVSESETARIVPLPTETVGE